MQILKGYFELLENILQVAVNHVQTLLAQLGEINFNQLFLETLDVSLENVVRALKLLNLADFFFNIKDALRSVNL